MSITLYNALILVGIIQGLIFSFWIFTSKKQRHKSNLYLAGVIFCLSLENLQFSLNEMNFINERTLYTIIYVPWAILVPPFLLFYGLTFLNGKTPISNRLKWLYVPFIAMFILSCIYKICVAVIQENENGNIVLNTIPWIGDTYGDFLNILFFIVIVGVLLKKILIYERKHSVYRRETIKVQLNWFKFTLLVLLILMVIWLGFTVIYVFDDDVIFYPLYLAASFTIYWLGYIGIYKIGVIQERKKIRNLTTSNKRSLLKENSKGEQFSEFQKLLISEKLYLDSSLKLEEVALTLKVSKGHLSRSINSELGVGFNDYVNNLRVEESKILLSNPDFSNYTLAAIGLEAGFNSKSTFYSTFKKFTGLTPLQFKNKPTD